ncbi:hypothetical protein A6R68_15727, partial [Neotoma lepida]
MLLGFLKKGLMMRRQRLEIEQTPYEEVQKMVCNHSISMDLETRGRQKCVSAELAKFDWDHYLADFFEDEAAE